MVKELTPQELRDFGFPELAFYKESSSVPLRGTTEDLSSEALAKEDSFQDPTQSKNPLDKIKQGKEAKADPNAEILQRYKTLISPLLSPLLRGKDGLIDLDKVPGGSFEEFKDFLKAQLSVDGRSFNDFGFLDDSLGKSLDGITDLFASYHRVIDRKEFEPLLRLLYEEKTGKPLENDSVGSPVARGFSPATGPQVPFTVMPASLLLGFKSPQVLASPEEAPKGTHYGAPSTPEELNSLIKQFTRSWIHISAQTFVGHHISQSGGRDLIKSVLQDKESFDFETRKALVEGIASQGEAHGVGGLNEFILNKNVSDSVFFNVRIWESIKQGKLVKLTDEDLDRACTQALEILDTADWSDKKSKEANSKYLKSPEKIHALPGISSQRIKEMARLLGEKQSHPDSRSELQAKLVGFWLLLADNGNFQNPHHDSYENRHAWIQRTEEFLNKSKEIKDQSGLTKLNEEVRDFLNEDIEIKDNGTLTGTTQEKIDNAIFHTIDSVSGHTLTDVFAEVPSHLKAAYTELKQYADEIHYADGEAERLYFDPKQLGSEDPKIKEASFLLIQGLQKVKRGMWHQYNQRSEVSQAGSWMIDQVGAGNKATIREATQEIDKIINRLAQAEDGETIKGEITYLQTLLKKDGVLLEGMRAAEFDGYEHLTQLIQTVLEIAGTIAIGRGIGTAANMAKAANLLKGQKLFQGAQLTNYLTHSGKITQFKSLYEATKAGQWAEGYKTYQDSQKIAAMGDGLFTLHNTKLTNWITAKGAEVRWGLKIGALLPAEDNLLAKLSDRVGSDQTTFLSTVKDSMATSLAMGFFTPFAMAVGHGIQGNIFRGLLQRYAGARGVFNFVWDGSVECAEEFADASMRNRLEGGSGRLSADEMREIGIVSMAGGGTKMGAVVQGFRNQPISSPIENAGTDPSEGSGPTPGILQDIVDSINYQSELATANGAQILSMAADKDKGTKKTKMSLQDTLQSEDSLEKRKNIIQKKFEGIPDRIKEGKISREELIQLSREWETAHFPEFEDDILYGDPEFNYVYFSPTWYLKYYLTPEFIQELYSGKNLLSVGAGKAYFEQFLVKALKMPSAQVELADVHPHLMPSGFKTHTFDMESPWPPLGDNFDYILFPESMLEITLKREDDSEIVHAFQRLLENALSHLKPGGEIRIMGGMSASQISKSERIFKNVFKNLEISSPNPAFIVIRKKNDLTSSITTKSVPFFQLPTETFNSILEKSGLEWDKKGGPDKKTWSGYSTCVHEAEYILGTHFMGQPKAEISLSAQDGSHYHVAALVNIDGQLFVSEHQAIIEGIFGLHSNDFQSVGKSEHCLVPLAAWLQGIRGWYDLESINLEQPFLIGIGGTEEKNWTVRVVGSAHELTEKESQKMLPVDPRSTDENKNKNHALTAPVAAMELGLQGFLGGQNLSNQPMIWDLPWSEILPYGAAAVLGYGAYRLAYWLLSSAMGIPKKSKETDAIESEIIEPVNWEHSLPDLLKTPQLATLMDLKKIGHEIDLIFRSPEIHHSLEDLLSVLFQVSELYPHPDGRVLDFAQHMRHRLLEKTGPQDVDTLVKAIRRAATEGQEEVSNMLLWLVAVSQRSPDLQARETARERLPSLAEYLKTLGYDLTGKKRGPGGSQQNYALVAPVAAMDLGAKQVFNGVDPSIWIPMGETLVIAGWIGVGLYAAYHWARNRGYLDNFFQQRKTQREKAEEILGYELPGHVYIKSDAHLGYLPQALEAAREIPVTEDEQNTWLERIYFLRCSPHGDSLMRPPGGVVYDHVKILRVIARIFREVNLSRGKIQLLIGDVLASTEPSSIRGDLFLVQDFFPTVKAMERSGWNRDQMGKVIELVCRESGLWESRLPAWIEKMVEEKLEFEEVVTRLQEVLIPLSKKLPPLERPSKYEPNPPQVWRAEHEERLWALMRRYPPVQLRQLPKLLEEQLDRFPNNPDQWILEIERQLQTGHPYRPRVAQQVRIDSKVLEEETQELDAELEDKAAGPTNKTFKNHAALLPLAMITPFSFDGSAGTYLSLLGLLGFGVLMAFWGKKKPKGESLSEDEPIFHLKTHRINIQTDILDKSLKIRKARKKLIRSLRETDWVDFFEKEIEPRIFHLGLQIKVVSKKNPDFTMEEIVALTRYHLEEYCVYLLPKLTHALLSLEKNPRYPAHEKTNLILNLLEFAGESLADSLGQLPIILNTLDRVESPFSPNPRILDVIVQRTEAQTAKVFSRLPPVLEYFSSKEVLSASQEFLIFKALDISREDMVERLETLPSAWELFRNAGWSEEEAVHFLQEILDDAEVPFKETVDWIPSILISREEPKVSRLKIKNTLHAMKRQRRPGLATRKFEN